MFVVSGKHHIIQRIFFFGLVHKLKKEHSCAIGLATWFVDVWNILSLLHNLFSLGYLYMLSYEYIMYYGMISIIIFII